MKAIYEDFVAQYKHFDLVKYIGYSVICLRFICLLQLFSVFICLYLLVSLTLELPKMAVLTVLFKV